MNHRGIVILYIILIIVVIGAFAVVSYLNFPLSGKLVIPVPTENQRMISRLAPEVRIKINDNTQIVLESPVYFDVRILPWFQTVLVEVMYRENGQALDGVGLQSGPGFNYNLQKTSDIIEHGNGWKSAEFNFDLNGGYHVRNTRRFLVSTTPRDGSNRGSLEIKSIIITARW